MSHSHRVADLKRAKKTGLTFSLFLVSFTQSLRSKKTQGQLKNPAISSLLLKSSLTKKKHPLYHSWQWRQTCLF